MERCIRRAPEGEHLTRNEIERMIKQVDKNRAQYRQMYSDTKWGAKESYHLCVNTTEKYMKEIVPGLAAMCGAGSARNKQDSGDCGRESPPAVSLCVNGKEQAI